MKCLSRQPFELLCGLKVFNKIVKAALEESLGKGDNQPYKYIYRLYERWAKGSLGLIIDLMISSKDKIDNEKWKRYADACQSHSIPTIVQINHVGRQSPMGTRRIVMDTSKEMTLIEIDEAVGKFADAAEIMAKAGFSEVEIHASHGYLVSSFLSPITNKQNDGYGATSNDRMKFLLQIIDAISAIVPRTFTLSVKLNLNEKLILLNSPAKLAMSP